MITEGTKDFSPAYSDWFGKSVVLLVAIRQCQFPLPCSIVGESIADVRIRIEPGWELAVRKDLILAVEEYVVALESRVSQDRWLRVSQGNIAGNPKGAPSAPPPQDKPRAKDAGQGV